MTTAKHNSRILDELHETARGLREAGLISPRRMAEFDALRRRAIANMPPGKIKQLREKAHMSQADFAIVLNTSVSTVQKWEIGEHRPSGPALKLLSLIERKGLEAIL